MSQIIRSLKEHYTVFLGTVIFRFLFCVTVVLKLTKKKKKNRNYVTLLSKVKLKVSMVTLLTVLTQVI